MCSPVEFILVPIRPPMYGTYNAIHVTGIHGHVESRKCCRRVIGVRNMGSPVEVTLSVHRRIAVRFVGRLVPRTFRGSGN